MPSDDKNIKKIFSTRSSHIYLSGVELYINVQSIEDTRSNPNRNDHEVANYDIRMTTKANEWIVSYSSYMVDKVVVNTNSRPIKYCLPIVDADVLQNINR